MSENEAIKLILQAQWMLEQVYSVYGDPDTELGRSLSVADTCCLEALRSLCKTTA